MAKVFGNIEFHSAGHAPCLYRSSGKLYVSSACRLTGKRVKADKAFAFTMVHARLLGRASRIASTVYRSLPVTFREYWMFRAFTGEALDLLRQGKSYDEATSNLWHTYGSVWLDKEQPLQRTNHVLRSRKQKKKSPGIHKRIRVAVLPSPQRHGDKVYKFTG